MLFNSKGWQAVECGSHLCGVTAQHIVVRRIMGAFVEGNILLFEESVGKNGCGQCNRCDNTAMKLSVYEAILNNCTEKLLQKCLKK